MDALGGDKPEQALEQAFIQLARGGDLPLLMAMVKAFMRVGLAGIAVRVLQSAGGVLAAEPQLASLADRLARLPSGEIDPEVLANRARGNLDAIVPTRPQLAPLRDHCAGFMSPVHVFVSTSGNQYVLRDSPDGKLDFVFPFGDQIFVTGALKLPETTQTTSFVMVGVPNAALWQRLLQLRAPNGYIPPIDVVEPDADILLLWLHLIDSADVLRDERVALFTGPDCLQQYRQFLIDHPWRWPATQVTTNFRPRWRPPVIDKQFQDSILAARAERKRQIKAGLDDRCAARDVGFWRRRFQAAANGGERLRIVGFTTRFSTVLQHSMRDLAAAFARRGCSFEIVKQPNQYCAAVDVAGALACAEYDMIVAIDHLRFEFADSIPASIPFVCWIQDYMDQLWDSKAGQSVRDLDLVIGHSPQVMSSLYGYPIERFIASNNLTDPDTYSNEPVPACDRAKYACDVSYVGHGAGMPEQLIDEIAAGTPATFRRMLCSFAALARERLASCGFVTPFELLELMLRAERETGHPPLTPEVRYSRVYPQLARIYDRLFRHEALEWAAEWAAARHRTFKIFGRGWENHPTLRPFACGEVESGFPLRCLYQASSISLQINGYGSMHQRLLDGLAAGAFMLSRYNPSDFIRQPFLVIQQAIRAHKLRDVTGLVALSRGHRDLADALSHVSSLCTVPIAPMSDSNRQRYCQTLKAAGGIEAVTTDQGLFAALESMSLIPHRTAADLPGFDGATFRTRAELHSQLDRFIDAAQARADHARPMRDAVLTHDTYASLVDRILSAFSNGSAGR